MMKFELENILGGAMYTVKCLNPIASKGLDLFTEDFKVIDDLDKADAVLVRSAAMHDLAVPESLLAVARAGAGVNNIPLDEYAKKGIVAFNTPGANANGVKELVVAGLLLASRDIIGGYNWVKENASEENLAKLVEKQKKQYAGNELKGKSIGVIGLGAIGVLVANICNRLGMKVYGYDPYVSVRSAWSLSRMVKHIASIDELFETCDYITIHVPYMDSTKGMINKEAIDKMKDGVTLLNFARGELVDIGGKFRIPEVLELSGAILKEVGTTNRTRIEDYKAAVSEKTKAFLKVHTSNYRIVGFTESVSAEELCELSNGLIECTQELSPEIFENHTERSRIPVIEDLGSGVLINLEEYGLSKEPTVQEEVKAGADVVCFSGDKLFGGAQAGVIVGKKRYIDQIPNHPLLRDLRADKFTLTAIEEVLKCYLDQKEAVQKIPTLRMLTRPVEEIKEKA